MTHSARVMLIEDNDDLRSATLNILQQAGFDATGIACAEDLDDAQQARQYDAYVVDINLPEENGFSLARRLRMAQPAASIIITTARSCLNDRVESYALGADVYMLKPVEPAELVAALKSHIARRQLDSEKIKDLQLDPDRLLLTGPRGKVRLAVSEVRLLLALVRAKDRTLERWQIMVQLSMNHEISADNLQNRLSQLRKKITRCGIDGESITAIRGVGYRLCTDLIIS